MKIKNANSQVLTLGLGLNANLQKRIWGHVKQQLHKYKSAAINYDNVGLYLARTSQWVKRSNYSAQCLWGHIWNTLLSSEHLSSWERWIHWRKGCGRPLTQPGIWGEAEGSTWFQKRRLRGNSMAILKLHISQSERRIQYTVKGRKAMITRYIKGSPSCG